METSRTSVGQDEKKTNLVVGERMRKAGWMAESIYIYIRFYKHPLCRRLYIICRSRGAGTPEDGCNDRSTRIGSGPAYYVITIYGFCWVRLEQASAPSRGRASSMDLHLSFHSAAAIMRSNAGTSYRRSSHPFSARDQNTLSFYT